jgi:protein-L-isoaspartate(D-aspartate) O-methyltransferase
MKKTVFLFLSFFIFLSLSSSPSDGSEDPSIVSARKKMVERNLKPRDITDPKILEIMGRIPRHLFVSYHFQEAAYEDHPLPIGEGQTISQPYIVALMTQNLQIKPGEKVLEIGTGSGYQAAVLAELTDQVFTVEIRENLSKQAANRLKQMGYEKVRVKYGDGYFGWEEYAPFDAIMITCAANHIPPPLIKQLKDGGRLILPLGGTTYFQTLTLLTKKNEKTDIQHLISVTFVPMIGEAQNK